ncbi:hypothetical protein THSYN_27000 [Candidatus Thiodictyon syntrophicum]|jgi:hypothetical protein|uniref:Uncharacterized protein n=1 Tax=Candidatus Thiodictyon syntrophicum TaxID=1166950 RepID=A0A2K8UF66_9GAMM|nr:hypothetical protein THSYN_27000 [Candidatus Thiodictyon syntrophicum]
MVRCSAVVVVVVVIVVIEVIVTPRILSHAKCHRFFDYDHDNDNDNDNDRVLFSLFLTRDLSRQTQSRHRGELPDLTRTVIATP